MDKLKTYINQILIFLLLFSTFPFETFTVNLTASLKLTFLGFTMANLNFIFLWFLFFRVGSVLCPPSSPIKCTMKLKARILVFNIRVPITKGFMVSFLLPGTLTMHGLNPGFTHRPGERSPEKDSCWHWLTFPQPVRWSSSKWKWVKGDYHTGCRNVSPCQQQFY